MKKLGQSITLSQGSTFNGSANITTGRLTGDVFIPEFTSTIPVLGVPTKLDQARPVGSTIALNPGGTVSVRASGKTTIPRLTGCGLLGPTLGLLLSADNPYRLTLAPPPSP